VETFNLEFFLGFNFQGAAAANVLTEACPDKDAHHPGSAKDGNFPNLSSLDKEVLSILSLIMMDEDGSTMLNFPTASVDDVSSLFAKSPQYYCKLPHF